MPKFTPAMNKIIDKRRKEFFDALTAQKRQKETIDGLTTQKGHHMPLFEGNTFRVELHLQGDFNKAMIVMIRHKYHPRIYVVSTALERSIPKVFSQMVTNKEGMTYNPFTVTFTALPSAPMDENDPAFKDLPELDKILTNADDVFLQEFITESADLLFAELVLECDVTLGFMITPTKTKLFRAQ